MDLLFGVRILAVGLIMVLAFARVVTRTPKSFHISPVLKSRHWLTINVMLASSLTRSFFHSELKTWFFDKSYPP